MCAPLLFLEMERACTAVFAHQLRARRELLVNGPFGILYGDLT